MFGLACTFVRYAFLARFSIWKLPSLTQSILFFLLHVLPTYPLQLFATSCEDSFDEPQLQTLHTHNTSERTFLYQTSNALKEGDSWQDTKSHEDISENTRQVLYVLLEKIKEDLRKKNQTLNTTNIEDEADTKVDAASNQASDKNNYNRLKVMIETYFKNNYLNASQWEILSSSLSNTSISIDNTIEMLTNFKNFNSSESNAIDVFFLNPEISAILKKSIKGFSYKIDEIFNSWLDDLPIEIKEQIIRNFPIRAQDGNLATLSNNPKKHSQERIFNRLQATIEAYQNHLDLDAQQKEALSKALSEPEALNETITIFNSHREIQSINNFFSDPQNVEVLKSNIKKFSSNLDKSFNEWIEKLPEDIRKQIAKAYPVKFNDGSKSILASKFLVAARVRIFNRIKATIEVVQKYYNFSDEQKEIFSKALSNSGSLEEAIKILNSLARVEENAPNEANIFFSKDGNIKILKRSLKGNIKSVEEIFDSFLNGLSPRIKTQMIKDHPVNSQDWANATHKDTPRYSARVKIFKRLKATFKAYRQIPFLSRGKKEILNILEKSLEEVGTEDYYFQFSEALKIVKSLSQPKEGAH